MLCKLCILGIWHCVEAELILYEVNEVDIVL